jgi:hypothetical protein
VTRTFGRTLLASTLERALITGTWLSCGSALRGGEGAR